MSAIGDTVRIYNMDHVIVRVSTKPFEKPTFYLMRTCDNSMWYIQTNHVNRFSHIKRTFDIEHADMDRRDVMIGLDAALRRI